MVKAKAFIFRKQFDGFPKESDLELVEEELPELKDGEFLAEAVYLSVDPYMRAYAPGVHLGTTFIGSQIALITESKNEKFPEGRYVVGQYGWRTHTVSDEKMDPFLKFRPFLLPDFEGLPLSLGLGVLGMPGNSAYFGLQELCQPKPGETVVISGAAGAVGSHAGQIAKIKGCRVIGIAGSDEKGEWLTEELKFDYFINYKIDNISKSLKEAAPDGIHCYFDNVGGELSSTVMNHMKVFGRISVCGAISGYNEQHPKASVVQYPIVRRQLRMEGFLVHRWLDRWTEGILQNKEWIKQGKLKYHETVTDGFENTFKAFTDMLKGVNIGKAIVRAKAIVK